MHDVWCYIMKPSTLVSARMLARSLLSMLSLLSKTEFYNLMTSYLYCIHTKFALNYQQNAQPDATN